MKCPECDYENDAEAMTCGMCHGVLSKPRRGTGKLIGPKAKSEPSTSPRHLIEKTRNRNTVSGLTPERGKLASWKLVGVGFAFIWMFLLAAFY